MSKPRNCNYAKFEYGTGGWPKYVCSLDGSKCHLFGTMISVTCYKLRKQSEKIGKLIMDKWYGE